MAETAVLFALGQVFQLLKEQTNLLRDVHKDFADIKDELESIQAILKDADRRAGDEADTNDGIRTWVKQLREASFRIEDVIDEYLWLMHGVKHPAGCGALVCKIASLIKTLIPRHQIASEIQDIKLSIHGIKERSERKGGLGKTTLAKHVFDSQKVRTHFDCRACITVSQSYTVPGLLINMMEQFCKETKEPLPQMLHKMDEQSLISEVRQYLQHKRYLIFFDDVWREDFSDQIQFAMPNNNKGSRVIITTRMMHVAEYFKKSFLVHLHNLQLLPHNKAWELFCKKAFRFELDGHCPLELEVMSNEIVKKCKGLPLAIVAIGGLFSTKSKTIIELQKVSQNLSLELGRNPHLTSPTKILSLSYDGLPYYLKPCILYFEEYLSELIHRSLVHISKVGFEGKVKTCQVHDLLWEVIIRKMKDLSFCHSVHEDDELVAVGLTRRLSVATSSNNVLKYTSNSHIRAIHVFEKGGLPEAFMGKLSSKSRTLKVLDFKGTPLDNLPSNLGNLFHLRYLNLSNTKVKALPKSFGNLQNLETLDLRETLVHELPSEINKLTKLRHLLVFHRNYEAQYSLLGFTTGVLMKKDIKNLTSLQNLCYVEVDHGGVNLIQEMGMLRQLRKFGIRHVRREYGNAICAAVVEMKLLEIT
ncbi:Virus X resistance protein-like, coiled-coil domain [Sesbania bispinosa]|nr:Virus X resistance protein-like, coiled-coil domain [Sesbania bispinosa]